MITCFRRPSEILPSAKMEGAKTWPDAGTGLQLQQGCCLAVAGQLPVSRERTATTQQADSKPTARMQGAASKRTASPQQADSKRPATTCHARVRQWPPCLERRRLRRRHRIRTSTAKKPGRSLAHRLHSATPAVGGFGDARTSFSCLHRSSTFSPAGVADLRRLGKE